MRVLDVKVGSNHVLALTEDGSVFGWGGNNFGQVGVSPETEHMATFPGQKVQSTVWTPVRIYPLNVPPET